MIRRVGCGAFLLFLRSLSKVSYSHDLRINGGRNFVEPVRAARDSSAGRLPIQAVLICLDAFMAKLFLLLLEEAVLIPISPHFILLESLAVHHCGRDSESDKGTFGVLINISRGGVFRVYMDFSPRKLFCLLFFLGKNQIAKTVLNSGDRWNVFI